MGRRQGRRALPTGNDPAVRLIQSWHIVILVLIAAIFGMIGFMKARNW